MCLMTSNSTKILYYIVPYSDGAELGDVSRSIMFKFTIPSFMNSQNWACITYVKTLGIRL
jgi:hypothetical protein